MEHRYCMRIEWSGPAQAPELVAHRLGLLFTTLGWLDEELRAFRFEDRTTGALAAADSEARCRTALAQGEVRYRLGHDTKICHEARFFVGPASAPSAELTVTCGVEPPALGPLYAPNRLELLLCRPAHAQPSRLVLENALCAAVALFQPDTGHVGSDAFPQPAEPLHSDGTPVVGWLTYLSSAFPAAPQALPAPAASDAVAGLGRLFVAHPDPFEEQNAAHRAAIDRLRATLAAAGVLAKAGDRTRGAGASAAGA